MNHSLFDKALPTASIFAFAASMALVFSFLAIPAGLAGGPPQCTVCHKRTTTITVPCNSIAHRRHIDHGDTMGACAATRTVREPKADRDTRS